MTSDQILLGLGLVLVLAVGSQLVARRLRIPAIVVLLPAGFLAGAATTDVHPDNLLGDLYQPFVSLAVGIILFEAGLRLSFGEVAPEARKVVARLVIVGVAVTCAGVAIATALLFDGMDRGVALQIGAILVVSGPTVVLPLLVFIRPSRGVRSTLKWEGVLVDPVGALLGVAVFHLVSSGWRTGEFLISVAVGLTVGVASAALLWVVLREIHLNEPRMAVAATLAIVVGAVVAADLLREDAGFVAATLMGVVIGNQRRLIPPSKRVDVSLTLEFQETLVQLLIGVLFVLIAASVSPSDVKDVLPEALVLVAVIVLLIRPVVVALATWGSALSWRERAFLAWMAPRGIVAGATAAAFGLELQQEGLAGAGLVLPIAFVAIFSTVVLYGFTAPLLARALGLAGSVHELVLVVGGHSWAREIAGALRSSGVAVRLWTGRTADLQAARALGLDADRGRMIVDALEKEAALEDVSDVLLVTSSDDFNALAAADLRAELGHGHVYRIAPDALETDLLPPRSEGRIIGRSTLTFTELSRRFSVGGLIVARRDHEEGGGVATESDVPLFVVSSAGRLTVVVDGRTAESHPGDTVLVLAPAAR